MAIAEVVVGAVVVVVVVVTFAPRLISGLSRFCLSRLVSSYCFRLHGSKHTLPLLRMPFVMAQTNGMYCRCSWISAGRNGRACKHSNRHMLIVSKPGRNSCAICKAVLCHECFPKPPSPKYCCFCSNNLEGEQLQQACRYFANINVSDNKTNMQRCGYLFEHNNNK